MSSCSGCHEVKCFEPRVILLQARLLLPAALHLLGSPRSPRLQVFCYLTEEIYTPLNTATPFLLSSSQWSPPRTLAEHQLENYLALSS